MAEEGRGALSSFLGHCELLLTSESIAELLWKLLRSDILEHNRHTREFAPSKIQGEDKWWWGGHITEKVFLRVFREDRRSSG